MSTEGFARTVDYLDLSKLIAVIDGMQSPRRRMPRQKLGSFSSNRSGLSWVEILPKGSGLRLEGCAGAGWSNRAAADSNLASPSAKRAFRFAGLRRTVVGLVSTRGLHLLRGRTALREMGRNIERGQPVMVY
jgi:hypothetical protein